MGFRVRGLELSLEVRAQCPKPKSWTLSRVLYGLYEL